MKASEEFRAAIRAGNLTDALVIAMTRAVELKVTTWVVAPGDPMDDSAKTLARPGHRLYTRMNLIQGDLENEVGDQFIGFGPYRDLKPFHHAFVEEGNQIVQDNLESLQKLFEVLIDLNRDDFDIEDWQIDSSGTDYQELPDGYEEPSGGFDVPPGGYEEPSGGFDVPPGGYDVPPTGYEEPSGGFDVPPDGYDVPPGGYEEPIGEEPEFEQPPTSEFEPLPPPPDTSEFDPDFGVDISSSDLDQGTDSSLDQSPYDPDFGVDVGVGEEDEFTEDLSDPISDVLETFSREPQGEIPFSAGKPSTSSPIPELPVSDLEVEDWEGTPETNSDPEGPVLSLEDLDLEPDPDEEDQWSEWDEPSAESSSDLNQTSESTNPFTPNAQEEWDNWETETSSPDSPSSFVSEGDDHWEEWTVEEPTTPEGIPNLASLDLDDDADWVDFDDENPSKESTTSPTPSSSGEIQDWDDLSEEELEVSYTESSEEANPFLAEPQASNPSPQEISDPGLFGDLESDEN